MKEQLLTYLPDVFFFVQFPFDSDSIRPALLIVSAFVQSAWYGYILLTFLHGGS